MKLMIYEKPTCTTCRQVSAILKEKGIDADKVDYFIEPLSEAKILDLLKKMRISAAELLRSNEEIYKTLELSSKKASMTDEQIVKLMVKHPELLQRPIAEKGSRAILARPAEKIREIL